MTKMTGEQLLKSAMEGVLIAGAFIVLGAIVTFLNGLLAIGVPVWTIIATVVILPLVGLSLKELNFNKLVGVGFSIAIVAIIAFIVPAAQFLVDPFTASVTGLLGLIAVVLHLAAAVALADKIRAMF